tara:strand:+ start:236 stop:886 length:651 start_codon:yes stop_codon:yes gene_type:complete
MFTTYWLFGFNFVIDSEFLRLFFFCAIIGSLIRLSLSVIHNQEWVKTKSQQLIFAGLPSIGFVITKVISGNIALSLGMVGALSIIRFRSPVKNPYELVSYFLLLTLGITTSVNPNLTLNLFFATVIISFTIELANFILSKFDIFSSVLEESDNKNYLFITTKENVVELKTSKLLSSSSFENDLYSYTFSSNSENELNNILNIVDEGNIVSYFFEKH